MILLKNYRVFSGGREIYRAQNLWWTKIKNKFLKN